MSEDDMFAAWEQQLAGDFDDIDVTTIPTMDFATVISHIRWIGNELQQLGELKHVKTERGLELQQLWARLKTRERDIVAELGEDF